jgi:hypothetical protein
MENSISGVMVSMLASCVVDHGFEPLSYHTKDYKIDICCFSARSESKDWLNGNQDIEQVCGFLRVLQVFLPIKLTATI